MSEDTQTEYPELEKLKAVRDKSQIIGLFIEGCGYTLCKLNNSEIMPYVPIHKSIEQILADYFKINLNKVEKERQHILDNL